MTHPFLKGVDWSALAMASMKSPLQEAAIISAKELNEAPVTAQRSTVGPTAASCQQHHGSVVRR